MDPRDRCSLPNGRRRRRGVVDSVDNPVGCDRRPFFVELHPETREGILRASAAIADRSDRRVCLNGSFTVLPVFRSVAGTDVFFDWHMGRGKPTLCRDQVFSVHAGWIGGDVTWRFEDVLPDP